MAGYLHGRQRLAQRPRAAYAWMLASLGLGTVLATLSKENGALLPLLLAVVEFCAPQTQTRPRPARLFLALCLWLPSIALLGYLLRMVDFSSNPWPHRTFNQPERLWTEARLMWDYLRNLFLPRIEGSGLYQDGIVVSHGWLSPPSTLLAAVGLLALFFVGIFARKRWPFLGLALLFFLAGHLLESTVVGLELYFEHRNYLPAAFLFLPMAQGLDALGRHISRRLVAGLAVAIVATLAFLTYQRATLWGQPEGLELYWALAAPDSPRAQNALANYYTRHGQADKADAVMRSAMQKMPDSPLLTMGYLLQKVYLGSARPEDFDWAAQRLIEQPFDAQAVMALRQLVDKVTQKASPHGRATPPKPCSIASRKRKTTAAMPCSPFSCASSPTSKPGSPWPTAAPTRPRRNTALPCKNTATSIRPCKWWPKWATPATRSTPCVCSTRPRRFTTHKARHR